MRKNLGKQTYLFPMPVLIIGTYNEDGTPNAMNAAWGGIYDTNQVFVCLAADHKTSDNVKAKKEFTISFADKQNMIASDYVGIVSGKKENKIEKAGWHHIKSELVNAPLFEEFTVAIECKVASLKEENETLYVVADIINVSIDESVLNNEGKFDSSKFFPISYDPSDHTYRELGNKIGNAFKEGKKIK